MLCAALFPMSEDHVYDQTHWAPTRRRGPLPTFYYHEHFVEMLEFVARHYAHVLLEHHVQLMEQFQALPKGAQCLYVRIVNRKGRIFAADKLRYPELGNLRSLLDDLRHNGWVGPPGELHYADVLSHLTKAEIGDVLLPLFAGMSRSLKKEQLIGFALEHCSADSFLTRMKADRLFVQRHLDDVRFLLFLYFGRVQDGLSQFTMRDLGLVRTHDSNEGYEARFGDSVEATENFFYASQLHSLKSAKAADLVELTADVAAWPRVNFSSSAMARDELAYRLGRKLERTGQRAQAVAVYERGESAQCSERGIRLLIAENRRDEAEQRLLRCVEYPRSDEERLMALDLYARKFGKKRTSVRTDELRAAAIIEIDEARSGSPERAAIEYFEGQGVSAYRTENLLWRTFFGLLFWNELFDDEDAMRHSPFETLPAALADGSFRSRFARQIELRLALLDDAVMLKKELLKSSTRNYGSANGVFRWRRSILEALFVLVDNAASEAMRQVLRRFCNEYTESRYGYPDLMIVDDDGARFIEIKTDGDQLRQNQLLRQQQLREAGFRADVVRIRWVLDPNQAYVVVDVETTGGRGERHRVTEIGAVKVQNGEIVDRFQTLLNPQRPIPTGIIRLTGITPAMVANAPLFADISAAFELFLQGAIFVAHNVDFDYRFIAQEFKRIGKPFRYPKLCTCASMRKLFPGYKSYSLASLCENFGIALKHHHRALCDAEAAAELLLLINEKRIASC